MPPPERDPLPIDPHLPEIARALARCGALVLTAPPGTGKTTRVPAALLDHGLGGGVVVLQPRRLATRAAARRVAAERGGELGDEVGYVVRHDRRVSARTRIRFVTEGVLVRRLVVDPFLEGVSAVVLDEFHERHLEADLAIAMLREVRETVRPDLRLVVMSATLETQGPAAFLGDCPVLEVASPLYPVGVVHADHVDRRPLEKRVAAAVARALQETTGDALVFLPGVAEIRAAAAALAAAALDAAVVPLHGRLSAAEQDAAIRPQEWRKVVLATNIAETSLTIEGITAVVDSGLVRVLRHDVGRGLDTLRVEHISRASAEQRRGRAGRTAPGVCWRLWTAGEERGLADRDTPEVHRVDVSGAVLQVRAFAGRPADRFGWFETPTPAALERAERLLGDLGASTGAEGRLTEIGRQMLDLPLHPRLARVMVAADAAGCRREAAAVSALLSERDVFSRSTRHPPADILEVVDLLERAETGGLTRPACHALGIDPAAARAVCRARDRIARGARQGSAAAEAVCKALLLGFPDRLARRPDPASADATLVGGRGLRLSPDAAAAAGELFLALQIAQTGRREHARARVVRLARIERRWLDEVLPERVVATSAAELDSQRARVVAVRRVCFGDLVLEETRGGEPDPAAAEQLLGGLLRRDPWPHIRGGQELRRFLARIAWLRRRHPEQDWPAIDDAAVAEAAAAVCAGRRDLQGLRGEEVVAVLRGQLPPAARRALDRRAPTTVDLPSGRRARIDYAAPAGPTLSVRLQELFGLEQSPTLGEEEAVVLELLAPNGRPVQVTRDLASFWRNVYPGVRSELRRRYPRHAWPEDPVAAKPTVVRRRRRPS